MTLGERFECEEALRRLDDYLDRSLPPEEIALIQAHLEGCLRCARQFRFEAAFIDGFRTRLRRLAVPPDLLRRIKLRLRTGTFM